MPYPLLVVKIGRNPLLTSSSVHQHQRPGCAGPGHRGLKAQGAPEPTRPAQLCALSANVTPGQPCCVCKDEKSRRDECMLFSNAADPQKDCQSTIDLYRSCMAGFGFKV